MAEAKKHDCVTCGTGFLVRFCPECAVGDDAWRVICTPKVPLEIRDHTTRIGAEHKKALDGILHAEFGGLHTVKNIAAALAIYLQRQADLVEAQASAAAAMAHAQHLAHSRHLASRLQKHSDLAAEKMVIARIKRVGKALRSLLGF